MTMLTLRFLNKAALVKKNLELLSTGQICEGYPDTVFCCIVLDDLLMNSLITMFYFIR